MTISAPSAPPPQQRHHPAPVLRVTFYDRISSFLMAAVMGLLMMVIAIIVVLPGMRQLASPTPPPELGFLPTGFEHGAPKETLHVDSPEDPIPNAAALTEDAADEPVENTLDTVLELADSSTLQIQVLEAASSHFSGAPGSADGTGRPSLGVDGDGAGPEQRWYVLFDKTVSVDEYARQLEFFGIEPAALIRDRGELIYLSDLTNAVPVTRVVTSGDDERLYMNWQGGSRRTADVELFERAGVDVRNAVLLHFYPAQTEELLAQLEHSFAERPADQIKRTYFVVVEQGSGYAFAVTRQNYAR